MDTIRNISLIGKINATATELNELILHLEQLAGNLHPVDKDSLLQKIQSIYGLSVMLQTNSSKSGNSPLSFATPHSEGAGSKNNENFVQESDADSQQSDHSKHNSSGETVIKAEEIEEIDVTLPLTKQTMFASKEEYQENSRPFVPKEVKETRLEKATTLDLFESNNPESLAEKLASQKDTSIAAKLEQSKIKDLRHAIGINDKFLFINELFEGNLSLYNKAIDELNSFQSRNGARTYLIELSVAYSWSAESPAKEKLHQLIDRKFEWHED